MGRREKKEKGKCRIRREREAKENLRIIRRRMRECRRLWNRKRIIRKRRRGKGRGE
jgi:hypothetical protein